MNFCPLCGLLDRHTATCQNHPLRLQRNRINLKRAVLLAAEHFPFDGTDPQTVQECRRRATRAILAALAEQDNR